MQNNTEASISVRLLLHLSHLLHFHLFANTQIWGQVMCNHLREKNSRARSPKFRYVCLVCFSLQRLEKKKKKERTQISNSNCAGLLCLVVSAVYLQKVNYLIG